MVESGEPTLTHRYTHIQTKTLTVQRPSHTCVWVKACWQSVCLSQYLGHMLHFRLLPGHSSFSCCPLLPINLLILFFFLTLLPFSLRNKGHPINFHSSPSPCQCHPSKEPQKQTKGPKKVKLLIWCQLQLERREQKSSSREIERRERRKETESERFVSRRWS